MIEVSIIMETYNLSEGSSLERFNQSLDSVVAMIPHDGSAQIIIADALGTAEIEKSVKRHFPHVRCIPTVGLGYDEAKMVAVHQSSGRFVLFLDCDCIPESGWLDALLYPLRTEGVAVCGGYTTYERGWLSSLMTIMDYGFFYPRRKHWLKCYASNNCGFRRETLESIPIRQMNVRCGCYCHSQRLLRSGIPVLFVPQACVQHDRPPIVKERSRRGYDMIVACLIDSHIPEAKWLRLGILSICLFYLGHIFTDWKRVCLAYRGLGLSFWQFLISFPLFPIFRIFDVGGMAYAFLNGPKKGGWDGFE